MSAAAAMLPDGRRLHLHHGPIDLIVEAFGPADERRAAYGAAAHRFRTILDELVLELPRLRLPLQSYGPPLTGRVARRMAQAVGRHRGVFVTPMASVAGAVSDEVIEALTDGGRARLSRAYVNNGGDIALWLAPGQRLTAAIVGASGPAETVVHHDDPVRGIATSGWRGRSNSLGIADAVTVLARTAAEADVASTLIANAVDLPDHPKISRIPACERDPDSDLGQTPVTIAVGRLSPAEVAAALDRGAAAAHAMTAAGLIEGAALFLSRQERMVGRTGTPELERAFA